MPNLLRIHVQPITTRDVDIYKTRECCASCEWAPNVGYVDAFQFSDATRCKDTRLLKAYLLGYCIGKRVVLGVIKAFLKISRAIPPFPVKSLKYSVYREITRNVPVSPWQLLPCTPCVKKWLFHESLRKQIILVVRYRPIRRQGKTVRGLVPRIGPIRVRPVVMLESHLVRGAEVNWFLAQYHTCELQIMDVRWFSRSASVTCYPAHCGPTQSVPPSQLSFNGGRREIEAQCSYRKGRGALCQ